MAKIVTKKSQIPKSAQKKIKNFSKLTDNQAILQYELNNLKRRLSKQADYTQFIKTPKSITKSFIQEIHNIRGKQVERFKQRFAKGEPLTSYEERKQKEYKRINDKLSKELDKISEDEIYDSDDSFYDHEPYTPEPSYTLDINDLIEKEKQYQSTQEYLKETGQAIDPFTGEVLEADAVADIIESAKQYLDDLMQQITEYEDKAIVYNSSYRNGRSRTSRSRAWIESNVKRAGDKIRNEIDRIRSSDDNVKAFAKKFSSPDKLQQLSDAIGEFIAECYSVVDTSSAYSASEVFMLLHDSPMSLDDSMEFEDEE